MMTMSNNQFKQNGIDERAFINYLPQLNKNILDQLIQQARGQGISEQQIQQGLAAIEQLRNNHRANAL